MYFDLYIIPHDRRSPTTRWSQQLDVKPGCCFQVQKKDMELSMEMVDGGGHNLTKKKILCPMEGQVQMKLKFFKCSWCSWWKYGNSAILEQHNCSWLFVYF